MEHLRQYIEGLNACIAAGVDVRTTILYESLPVIRTITINETVQSLFIWYLRNGRDHQYHLPITAKFTVEFNDLPNDLHSWYPASYEERGAF